MHTRRTRRTRRFSALTFAIGCALLGSLASACSGDGDGGGNDQPDAGIDAPVTPTCFEGTPTTHEQLINACVAVDIEKIDKRPTLPLLNNDGTLPLIP
jgi:hypothetical protein